MGMTFYEIDPIGDTLLILHNANAPFAVVPAQEERSESGSALDDKPTGEPQNADSKPKEEDSKPQDADSKPTLQMRLSSKHLALASKYFQKLTTSNMKETTPEYGYSFVINANDWDEKALLVLMNIIHGRTTKVPRSVDLEMLAKIAVLVDYYQCHEAVEFFAKTWLGPLSTSIIIPKEGERNFMLRLVVCLVFSENFNFWLLTKTIIWGSKKPINSLGLPIQQDIIDALNKSREDAIRVTIADLNGLRRRLCQDQSCSFECSSIYLGALVKAMTKMQVMDSPMVKPYRGLSLLMLEQAIRDIKEPSWLSNCLGASASAKASTKPAPKKTSSLFGNAPSTDTKTPPAQAGTTPKANVASSSSGGLFGKLASSGGLFDKPASSGGLFDKPASSGGLFDKPASSGGLFDKPASSGGLFDKPASSGGLFDKPASSGGLFDKPASSGGLFDKPASSGGLFGKSAPGGLFDKSAILPRCNLAAKTKPIIDGLLKDAKGLEFSDYVKKE